MENHFSNKHSVTNTLVKKLSDLLREPFFKKFNKLYERARKEYKSQDRRSYNSPLIIFQRLIERSVKWDKRKKIKEFEKAMRLTANFCRCYKILDYML